MASLNKVAGTLGLLNARHLLRRLCFKYTNELVELLANLSIQNALDILLTPDSFKGAPFDPKPIGNPDGY